MTTTTLPDYLTTPQAAAVLGIGISRLRQLVRAGYMTPHSGGHYHPYRFTRSEVEREMERRGITSGTVTIVVHHHR